MVVTFDSKGVEERQFDPNDEPYKILSPTFGGYPRVPHASPMRSALKRAYSRGSMYSTRNYDQPRDTRRSTLPPMPPQQRRPDTPMPHSTIAQRTRSHDPNTHYNSMRASHTDARASVRLQRDLHAPKTNAKHRTGAKARRDVIDLNQSTNHMVSRYSPSQLAQTRAGGAMLLDVARLQRADRVNQVMAEQITGIRQARQSPAYTDHLRSATRAHGNNTPYHRHKHSSPGGAAKPLTRMVGANGASYTMRASGAKQYYHRRNNNRTRPRTR